MGYFKKRMLILLVILVSVSLETAFAQEMTNASIAANASVTNASLPQETRSSPLQLSGMGGTEELAQIAGAEALFNTSQINPLEAGTRDVTRSANITNIFRPNPSVGVDITGVDPVLRLVQITNFGIGAWNLTGWSLSSGGNATYMFSAFELEDGASVRVREGMGINTAADVYTNSTAPLWTGNTISLLDEAGNTVSTTSVPA